VTGSDSGDVPDRRRTVDDLVAAWDAFAGLVEGLGPGDWDRATRCDGWQVRHVAGHVTGMTVDAAAGHPTTDPDQQAATYGRLGPTDLARTLRTAAARLGVVLAVVTDGQWVAPLGDRFPTLGEAVQTLLHDVHVHADDIATAVGRAPWTGPGLRAAVDTVATRLRRRGWTGPAVVVDGRTVLPGPPATPAVHVDAHDLVLAATGRLAPTAIGLDATINIYPPP